GGGVVTAFGFDWRPGEPLDSGWKLTCEKIRPEDGATLRIFSHDWHEPARQFFHSEQRFEVELNGRLIECQLVRRSPEGRYYTQAQAAELYRHVGFARVQVFSGFTHED